jgi:parallel beta-helix repeat protein
VHGNNFTDEINDAIDIDFGAGGNSVYNNTAINASELLGLIETSGNEVYDNYAYGFTCDGIWLSDASENVIHNNILQDNGLSGCCAIDLGTENGECANNYIYSNMLNSTINVCFFGDVYGNYWNTTRGNYYTNPTGSGYSDNCIDVDVNGFCDLPYDVYNNESCMLLDGCSNNTDYLPLWGGHVVPTVPTTPAISITSYDYHWVNLTIGTCTDIGGSGISKRVLYRDTTNIANFTGSTATRYNSTGLANSTTYTWRLSCLDNYGLYSANSSVSLTMPSTGYIQKYSSTEVGYTIQDTLGAFFSAIATYSGTIMLIVVSILCLGGVVLIYLKIRSTAK